VEKIQAILITAPRDHWLELFAAHAVPAGPIQRLDQVAADPALSERELFYRMSDGEGRRVPQVNTGVRIDGRANAPRHPPPALAEHATFLLRSLLGKSDDEIEKLRAAGII